MIADTTFLLIVMAVLSSLKVGVKSDKFISWLIFLFVTGIFVYFMQHGHVTETTVFSFVWNSSPSGNIMVDIVSNSYNCQLIFPFFLMTLMAIGYNNVFRYEERRGLFDAVMLFNLTALIMMITSNNLVQLLSGLFVVDIMALLIIKDVEKSKYYATFNLIADMMLFTVLAVVNCQLESLDLRQIIEYNKIGFHQDFVALVGLSAVFIKFGLVPFHGSMLRLKDIRYHRLQNVLFLTSPASALILLQKFYPLWQSSLYFLPVLQAGCVLGLVWGLVLFAMGESLKLKTIYWQMFFTSILVLLLADKKVVWSENFSILLVCQYLCISLWYFLYYNANRCASLLKLKSCCVQRHLSCYIVWCIFLLVWTAEIVQIFYLKTEINSYLAILLAVPAWVMAQVFHLFCVNNKSSEAKKIMAQPKLMFWLLSFWVVALVLVNTKPIFFNIDIKFVCLPLFVFVVATFMPVANFMYKIYANNWIQENDMFQRIYHFMIVEPIQWCGRVLAVLIDRMLVEKMIVGAASLGLQGAVRLFRNIHYNRFWGGIIMLLLLGLLLALSFHNGRIN